MIRVQYIPTKQDSFSYQIKERVAQYLKGQSPRGNWFTIVKSVLIMTMVIVFYVLIFTLKSKSTAVSISLCFGLAISILILGLNVLHEACHSNLSRFKSFNKFMSLGFDIFGGISSQQYCFKHNIIHHRFTNLGQFDADLDNVSILRLSPAFTKMNLHKWQWLYAPFLYSLITMTWAFDDIERLLSRKVAKHILPKYSKRDIFFQLFLKLIYFTLALVLPILVFGSLAGLLGFLFVHTIMGFSIALIFQMAHVVEVCDFPSANSQSDKIEMNETFIEHQLRTTADFAHHPVIDFFLGGLNYQIEHHIFPNVSSRHYPEISKIIKATCEEYGVEYNYYPTLSAAAISHFRHLSLMGKNFSSVEHLSKS